MKKRSYSPLILAFAFAWATGASAALRKSKPSTGKFTGGAPHASPAAKGSVGAIASGKTRSFTTPVELKKNATVPSGNGGGGPPSTGGTTNTSGPAAQAFSFGSFSRPLKKPVIKRTSPQSAP